jgi:hypothetical protein
MSTKRRKFLVTGAAGAAGLAGFATVGHVTLQAQSNTPAPASSPTTDNPNRQLAGKMAIVTGARANFERAFSVALAKHGADVVVHYHRRETIAEAEETARLVQEQGTRTALVQEELGHLAVKSNPLLLMSHSLSETD